MFSVAIAPVQARFDDPHFALNFVGDNNALVRLVWLAAF